MKLTEFFRIKLDIHGYTNTCSNLCAVPAGYNYFTMAKLLSVLSYNEGVVA